jgi:hypothetical protein
MGVQACPTLVCWKNQQCVEVRCALRGKAASKAWRGCRVHCRTSCPSHEADGAKHAQVTGRGEGGNPATLIALLDKHAGRGHTAIYRLQSRWLEHLHLEALDEVCNVTVAGPKPSRPRWQGLLVKAAIAAAAAAAIGFAVTHLRGQSSEAKAAALDGQMKVCTALLLRSTASASPFAIGPF